MTSKRQAGHDDQEQFRRGRRDEAEDTFVQCPEEGCEELILVADLNDHLDFHDAQQATLEETPTPGILLSLICLKLSHTEFD